jgi:hypothetical protein
VSRRVTSVAAFEAKLADALNRYAAAAPIDVDAVQVATLAAAAHAGRSRGTLSWGRPLRLAVLVALLLALVAGAILVIGAMQRERVPWWYADARLAPSMSQPRVDPALVGLSDGRILVLGGDETRAFTAEVLDPTGNASVPSTAIGAEGLQLTGAVALPSGRALLLGATAQEPPSAVAQLFDPTSGTFAQARPPLGLHMAGSIVALADGRVLVSGGTDAAGVALAAAELFDPNGDVFADAGRLLEARARHMSLALPDGRAVILGGESGPPNARRPVLTVEVYEPATDTFVPSNLVLTSAVAAGVLTPAGVVVVFLDREVDLALAWDPVTGGVTMLPDPPRTPVAATALDDGRILLLASHGDGLRTMAVVYDPDDGSTMPVNGVQGWLPAAARLPDGRVLLAGGRRDGHVHGVTDGVLQMAPAIDTVQIVQ